MRNKVSARRWSGLWVAGFWLILGTGAIARPPQKPTDTIPAPRLGAAEAPVSISRISAAADQIAPPVPLNSALDPNHKPIDLNTALRVAGVQNPDLMIARQRVVEAVALRQLAAAAFLPSLNAGTSYDSHTGVLQQSNGNILSINRSAVYVGSGSNAVGAGTVAIPGIFLQGNLAETVFAYLVSRQMIVEREATTFAVRNQQFLQVCLAYSELLRAEGKRAIAMQVRDEAFRVYKLVAAYSKAGAAKPSDADRFATELARRQADVQLYDGQIGVASARLCEVMNVDPSIRLHPTDAWVVPAGVVPPQVPLQELVAVGLLRRPELAERRAVIRQSLLSLEGSKLLPFTPTYVIGFSAGGFGGGSNLVFPTFGGFGGRSDFDVMTYWTLKNLGVGNIALINLNKARLQHSEFQEIAVMDRVRAEVAEAYARSHAQFNIITTTEQAVRSSTDGFREDLLRAEGAVGLPIEARDSLRLLADSRYQYLDSIIDFNEAQFSLYVALGQPPANYLARPVPTAGVVPPGAPMPTPANPSGVPIHRGDGAKPSQTSAARPSAERVQTVHAPASMPTSR
jgi:outer membrane protein TolC